MWGFIRYIVLYILVSCLVGWLLCNIDPDKTYTWYSGIWHGMFFISNFIRSWFTDALYKAESYTAAYNVFWWIFTGLSVFSFFLWRRCQKKIIMMRFVEFRHASQKV